MGVLNVTPDSFSDGGDFYQSEAAVNQGLALAGQGADIIDVGGESTRPRAKSISTQQELDRVIPVIESLSQRVSVPISIDTSNPVVMRDAVAAGAGFINDVRALTRPGALEAAAQCGVPVCLMHMQGSPKDMQAAPYYEDVVVEVSEYLAQRKQACLGAGIPEASILVDPGFGFGKSLKHNLTLLQHLDQLGVLNAPILVGLSRKSMLQKILDKPVDQRIYGSLALAVIAIGKGASIVRVHDVAATVDAIKVCRAVFSEGKESL